MAVTIDHYDQFVELMGDFATTYGGWPNDTLDIIIMNSTHVFTATNTVKTNISANEIPTGNGYTQGAEVLASVTSSQPVAGTWMLDAADASWTASGGPIPTSGDATDAVVYDETVTVPLDALMFDIDFGVAESAGDGTDFIISWDANGICRIT
ncbi:MAG: hypothetical protein ACXABY_05355 [Candidatus Thorarchaeota archaeon]|jgi:hypothetical protein